MAICMEQVRLYLPTVLGDQDFFLHDHQPQSALYLALLWLAQPV